MKAFQIFITAALCLAASCNSTKTTADKQAQDQAMIDQGYVSATVVLQPQEEGCPVIIKTENEMLDPIDLSEDFKEDQLAVWVKFARLRRMNRCAMAGPVSITEIQKKAD